MLNQTNEWVIRNASLFTAGQRVPGLTDIVIAGDRIARVLAAGTECDAALHSVDARGRLLSAGLTDAHAHLDRQGLTARLVQLGAPRSRFELLERIAEAVSRTEPGQWIVTEPLGTPPDYNDAVTPGDEVLPALAELDAVSGDNPVYIRPIWGYWNPDVPLVSMANSLALCTVGITTATPSPSPRVTIERDGGALSGVFIERTRQPIIEHTLLRGAPSFSPADRVAGVVEGMRVYNSFGTTSIFEGHGIASPTLEAYGTAAANGPITINATLMLSADWRSSRPEDVAALVSEWGNWARKRSSRLDVPGIYVEPITDGDHEVRRGSHPETGWAGFSAASVQDPEALQVLLDEAARARVRVSTIFGPVASMMERSAERIGDIRELRWVVSHQQSFSPTDLERISRLGLVVTTVTAHHIFRSGEAASAAAAGGTTVVPLRTMLDRGIPFALGTDNRPPTLFDTMRHVVERRGHGGGLVDAEEALSREEALDALTRGGAYLAMQEDDRGVVEAGQRADLVLWRSDPLEVPIEDLGAIEADVVVVGGTSVLASG